MNLFLERLGGAIRRTLQRLLHRPAGPEAPDLWTEGSFSQQGRAVAYKLFVPGRGTGTGTGTKRPLLLMLHGCTQDPDDFAAGTRMNEHARRHGMLVLYPAQTPLANPAKCWNWFKGQHQRPDRGEPALLAALTESVMNAHDVDPARVYVAGLSAGGAMADILAHTHPELFAAVGVHSGLPFGAAADLEAALAAMKDGAMRFTPAPAGRALPVIVFHGGTDARVHPRNGEQVVAAALASVPGERPREHLVANQSPDGRGFIRRRYVDARSGLAVEYWRIDELGHAWSGGSAQGSHADPAGVDASAAMLRFFLAHPKRPARSTR